MKPDYTYKVVAGLMLLAMLSLASCFKEKKIAPPAGGVGQTATVSMGPDYTDQFFYSLTTNKVLSQNSRFAYDLMFDCDPAKFHIWLNTAKFMCAYNTGSTNFSSITAQDTNTTNWVYERGSYNTDSSALGNWYTSPTSQPASAGNVYVINQGVDLNGNELGYVKLQVNNFYGNSYSVTFASLTTPGDSGTILVTKDNTRNYRYLAFTGAGQLLDSIEPDKTQWDLCFTHYTVVFYEPGYLLPYPVTGVLSNPYRIQAYVDSLYGTKGFDTVTFNDFNMSNLQTNRDAIGYDWKTWTGTYYTTKTYYLFFIKTNTNQYYKMHFLSFNNSAGIKGYPTFEYQQF